MMQSAMTMRGAEMEDTATVVERQLEAELSAMSLEDSLSLARAFAHHLNLMGIAERHHRYVRTYPAAPTHMHSPAI